MARGVAHQARLTAARRLDDRPWLQRRLVDRAVTMADRWSGERDDPVADLHAAEASRWSQNGEDGLIAALVERVGAGERSFVEIGSSDGAENCTRALAEDGWRGVWFEGDPQRAATARATVTDLDVRVVETIVTSRNVGDLLAANGVDAEPTVAVVDIDGSDLWVLRAVLARVSPRIVVVEYNATFPPGVFWTRRNRRSYSWPETYEHGASLDAMVWAASVARYRLVACDSTGVNAFFVRSDLLAAAGLVAHPLDRLYRPMLAHAPIIGHPWRHGETADALTADDRRGVALADAHLVFSHPERHPVAGRRVGVRATVRNASDHRLSSGGPNPISLSARLVAADGSVLDHECERNLLIGGVPAGRDRPVAGVFTVPDSVAGGSAGGGATALRLMLVQDGVAWFDEGAVDVALP